MLDHEIFKCAQVEPNVEDKLAAFIRTLFHAIAPSAVEEGLKGGKSKGTEKDNGGKEYGGKEYGGKDEITKEEFHKGIVNTSPPVKIHLTPWDLFHGHIFVEKNRGNNQNSLRQNQNSQSKHTFGILFHAKEYPKEYTSGCTILPIGHKDAGGDQDPRIGTTLSIKDQDFPYRNFLWSESIDPSRIFLIDVLKQEFPKHVFLQVGTSGSRYYTCDEEKFGVKQIGHCEYYFSHKTDGIKNVLTGLNKVTLENLIGQENEERNLMHNSQSFNTF